MRGFGRQFFLRYHRSSACVCSGHATYGDRFFFFILRFVFSNFRSGIGRNGCNGVTSTGRPWDTQVGIRSFHPNPVHPMYTFIPLPFHPSTVSSQTPSPHYRFIPVHVSSHYRFIPLPFHPILCTQLHPITVSSQLIHCGTHTRSSHSTINQ